MTYYWQESIYDREDVEPVRYIQVYERRPLPPQPQVRRATLSRVEYYQPQQHNNNNNSNYYQECPNEQQPVRTARVLRSNTMRLIKPVETVQVPIQINQQITLTPVIQSGQRTYSTAKINLIDSVPVQVTKTIQYKPAIQLHAKSLTRLARSSTSANLSVLGKPTKSLVRLAEPIKVVNYHPVPLATVTAVPVKTCMYQNSAAAASNLQQAPIEFRNVVQNDGDVHMYVRDNNNYRQFNKTIVTTVNRNHLHTHRVVTNENNYDTYVTNNIIRINDIHHNRIEHVPGEKRTFNEYKTTQTIEQPTCRTADNETTNDDQGQIEEAQSHQNSNALADENNSPKALSYNRPLDDNYNNEGGSYHHSSINL